MTTRIFSPGMFTPHPGRAGAAAMVIASDALGSKKGPRQVRDRLLATARLPEFARGLPATGFGAGIVNLGKAVNPNHQ